MATSQSGIDFEELEGSPRIRISAEGVSAVRRLLTSWDTWDVLAHELYGIYRDVAGDVVFSEPLPFPGDRPNLRVESVEVEPINPGVPDGRDLATLTVGTNRYEHGALLTVTYQSQFDQGLDHPFNPVVPAGTYVTYAGDFRAEQHVIDSLHWRWQSTTTNVPTSTTVSVITSIGQHQLTWHRVARPPFATIHELQGKVNANLFLNAEPETLLFLGARTRRQFQIRDDSPLWQIEYSFAEKRHQGGPFGWNHFFRKDADPHSAQVEAATAPHTAPDIAGDFQSLFLLG